MRHTTGKRHTAAGRMAALILAALLLCGARHAAAAQAEEESAVQQETVSAEAIPVDIDLTPLSQTMLIARSAEIIGNPDEYIGKRIRTVGILQAIEFDGRTITSIYLGDASGCCGTALEFNRAGDYRYPEDYPSAGSVIFVEGTFERYEEDGVTYCWLNDAVMSTQKFTD